MSKTLIMVAMLLSGSLSGFNPPLPNSCTAASTIYTRPLKQPFLQTEFHRQTNISIGKNKTTNRNFRFETVGVAFLVPDLKRAQTPGTSATPDFGPADRVWISRPMAGMPSGIRGFEAISGMADPFEMGFWCLVP